MKYSLVKLMENEGDEATFSIGKISNDVKLTPLTKTSGEIISIINDPKNYKTSFIKNPTFVKQAKENHFGIGVPPAVKNSMEKDFTTLSKEEWIEKNKKYKDLEKKYETLSNNNGKFYVYTKDTNTAFESELNYTPKPNDLTPNKEKNFIRFIPNDVITYGKIERSLEKILTSAGLKKEKDYTITATPPKS
jgi:hypothetical protein